MNIRRLIYLITILSVFAMAARFSMDTDTWWHLRAGKWIVENGAIPQTEPFSYTRFGEAWQYPGWLVELPMYGIFNWFGPGGLNVWTAVMVTLAFIFLWSTLTGGPFLRAFVIILAAAASAIYWAARPYLVTFLLAAVYLWILESWRWDKNKNTTNRLWLLPLLMVLWANSHGGYAVGFLLWGVYFVWEGGRILWMGVCLHWVNGRSSTLLSCHEDENDILRNQFVNLSLIGLLMVLAVCINPSGLVMLTYPFKTIGIEALREYIQEWQSPDFHALSVQPFAWLLLLTFGVVGASRKRLAFTDFALVAGFAYMGLMAGRNVAIFALVAPIVLTRHASPLLASMRRIFGIGLGESDEPITKKQAILNWGILIVLVLLVLLKVSQVYPQSVNEAHFEETLPVGAVEYLKKNKPPGRLFNSYNWGGYLLWALPEYPVFVDGRTDLYDDEIISEWLQVVQAQDGWQDLLDMWEVRLILVEPERPINDRLKQEGWDIVYQDELAVLYIR